HAALLLLAGSIAACAAAPSGSRAADKPVTAESIRVEAPTTIARPPYQFNKNDDAFLEEVSYGAFMFLWQTASPSTGMPPYRASKNTISVAGVGFFLSGIPIAIERGWVTREQATHRVLLMLRT
ncbi:MAG: hypothetical protein ACK58T_21795, partial [Phycisphaerae bacterium]